MEQQSTDHFGRAIRYYGGGPYRRALCVRRDVCGRTALVRTASRPSVSRPGPDEQSKNESARRTKSPPGPPSRTA